MRGAEERDGETDGAPNGAGLPRVPAVCNVRHQNFLCSKIRIVIRVFFGSKLGIVSGVIWK